MALYFPSIAGGMPDAADLEYDSWVVPKPIAPPELRLSYQDDDVPQYFAVLESAWRNPAFQQLPFDGSNSYRRVARDEPLANEFRVYFRGEHGMHSIPVGSRRDIAETIVHAMNAAFNFGLVHARRVAETPKLKPVLVGRMGHINRLEELMP